MSEISTTARTGFGTGEWADINRNCMTGCSNDCAYCYSRANALKHGTIANRAAWPKEAPDTTEIARRHTKLDGLVMFPTRHDTTPANIQYNLPYMTGLLEAGNEVLFVTKANLSCMKEICSKLAGFKEQLLIRVTIGGMNPTLCKFWERNAPSPQERLQALQHAFDQGFQTSVSMEPILHGVDHAIETFKAAEPYVTEKIWIGAMNGLDTRVDTTNPNFKQAVTDLKKLQSKDELIRLYDMLKDEPKVLWKESIAKIVGLPE